MPANGIKKAQEPIIIGRAAKGLNPKAHTRAKQGAYKPIPIVIKAPKTKLPMTAITPPSSWQQAAKNFIVFAQGNLLRESQALSQLTRRGLNAETIQRFCLGWNPETLFLRKRHGDCP